MKLLLIFWQKFKTSPDGWFFYGFLATFTLSVRKVLLFYPIAGGFNEYAGIYLYLSDLFLILALVFWILSYLYNKKLNLSIYTHKLSTLINRHNLLITVPLALIVWSFISIGWSGNWQIALFRSIKFLEFYFLYLYVIFRIVPSQSLGNVPRVSRIRELFHVEQFASLRDGTFQEQRDRPARIATQSVADGRGTFCSFFGWSIIFKIIILAGLIQSIIGIWQFIIQKSIGISWLKESLVSPNIDGVAKILIGGHKYIRAYGLFPHPNILGGFLLVSVALSIFYTKMFHPRTTEIVPSQSLRNVPRVSRIRELFHVEQFASLRDGTFQEQRDMRGTISECGACVEQFFSLRDGTFIYLLPIFVLIQIIALFLTFSKSAWIGLVITLGYIYLKVTFGCSTYSQEENVPPASSADKRGTFNIWKIAYYIQNKIVPRGTILVVAIAIVVLALFIPKLNLSDFIFNSINERVLYLDDSVKVIRSSLIVGIGSGQFVLEMQKYSQTQLEYWQFQPVHNVFLLIWSELGIVGLFIFLWFMRRLFSNKIENECSTPVRQEMFHPSCSEMFHVEHFKSNGTGVEHFQPTGHAWNNLILYGMEQLTIFKGILLGLIFIMLFDHYLWDIQQGQIILWLVAGIIANNALYKPKYSILTK